MIINLGLASQPNLSFWSLVSLIIIKIILLKLSNPSSYSFYFLIHSNQIYGFSSIIIIFFFKFNNNTNIKNKNNTNNQLIIIIIRITRMTTTTTLIIIIFNLTLQIKSMVFFNSNNILKKIINNYINNIFNINNNIKYVWPKFL